MTQTNTSDISDILERFGLTGFDTPSIEMTLNRTVEEYIPQSRVGQRIFEGAGLALGLLAVGYLGAALVAGVPTETHAAEQEQTNVDMPWHSAYASASIDTLMPAALNLYRQVEFDGQEFAVSIDPNLEGLHINGDFVSLDTGTNCEVGQDSHYCVGSLVYHPDSKELGFTIYKTKPLSEIERAAVVDTI